MNIPNLPTFDLITTDYIVTKASHKIWTISVVFLRNDSTLELENPVCDVMEISLYRGLIVYISQDIMLGKITFVLFSVFLSL